VPVRDRVYGTDWDRQDGFVITFSSAVPVLPVRDLAEAAARYRRLGFAVRDFEGGDYAFASRGEVNLHLATVTRVQPDQSTVAVFLYVSTPTPCTASGQMPPSMVVSSRPFRLTTGSSRAHTSTPTATFSASARQHPGPPSSRSFAG